jgi:hypothetical protein
MRIDYTRRGLCLNGRFVLVADRKAVSGRTGALSWHVTRLGPTMYLGLESLPRTPSSRQTHYQHAS